MSILPALRRAASPCPRCYEDHEALPFWSSERNPGRLWALCPVEADPLILVEDRDGKEKIVAIEGGML